MQYSLKTPYNYSNTPLNKPTEGVPINKKNLIKFYVRLKNREWLAKSDATIWEIREAGWHTYPH